MTSQVLEAPSALPQFPSLPAPSFQALLWRPQPKGCRDGGMLQTAPGVWSIPHPLPAHNNFQKQNTSSPQGGLAWLCCFSKIYKTNKKGNINFSLALQGRAAHLHTPWEAKSRSWHHTG